MNVGGISLARPVRLRVRPQPQDKPHAPVVIVVPTGKPSPGPSPAAIHKVRGSTAGALIGASIGLYTSTMLLSGMPGMVAGLTLGGLLLGGTIGALAS